jgi:predicted DCC family thiol-disulfide oxidoreductase YuxK
MNAIIIFDGVCGVCNAYVRFVIRRDPQAYFKFASSQSTVGIQLLGKQRHRSLNSLVVVEAGTMYTKSDAVLRIFRQLTGWWPWCWYLRHIPRPIRDACYDWFAKYRYQLGTTTGCQLPTIDEQNRLILP